MSEKLEADEIPEYLSELGDDWKKGPWDRRVTSIQYANHRRYSEWDGWKIGIYIDNNRCRTNVRIEDSGSLLLYGGSSSMAGQVQRYARRVALLTVMADGRFIRCLRERLMCE